MDADTAVTLINDELTRNGHPQIFLTEPQRIQAFASLKVYAAATGRPLEVAARDVARFQIQTLELGRQS